MSAKEDDVAVKKKAKLCVCLFLLASFVLLKFRGPTTRRRTRAFRQHNTMKIVVVAAAAVVVVVGSATTGAGVAACDSRRKNNTAVKSLGKDNGSTLDVGSVDECEAACCDANDNTNENSPNCTAWTFTPETRAECSHHGCCFLKKGAPAEVNANIEVDETYTTG